MTGSLREGWNYARDYSEFLGKLDAWDLRRILDNPERTKKLYEFMMRYVEHCGITFNLGTKAYWFIYSKDRAKVCTADKILSEAFRERDGRLEGALGGSR